MESTLLSQAAKTVGISLLLLASLTGIITIIMTPFSGCTEVRVEAGENTGFEFHGIEDGDIVYSPNSVNECSTPVGAALIPFFGFTIGIGIFRWGSS